MPIGLDLWEAVVMLKEGQIVTAQGHGKTTFKIIALMQKGRFATIQAFSVSQQALLGQTVNVLTSTLTPLKEDASQSC